MTPTLLSPPEPPRPAPPAEPMLRVRAPLGRHRGARTPLLGRRAVAGSLAVHIVLAAALLLAPVSPLRPAQRPVPVSESVSYLDLGEFPAAPGAAGGREARGTVPGAFPSPDPVPSALPQGVHPVVPARSAAPTAGPGLRYPTRTPTGASAAVGRAGQQMGAGAASGGDGTTGDGGGRPGSAANGQGVGGGRLRPGYRDPRLYTPREIAPETPPRRSDIQRYRDRLQARLGVYNDSVADEAAHQRRIRNWTFKGKDGREYGIAEGGVPVVAGRRIPLPVALGVPIPRSQERDDQSRARERELRQIDRQAEEQDRDRYTAERNRAVRERQDSVRRARKP